MIEKNKITITVAGFEHSSECGIFLPDMIEAFEHLLKTGGYIFDGQLDIEKENTLERSKE